MEIDGAGELLSIEEALSKREEVTESFRLVWSGEGSTTCTTEFFNLSIASRVEFLHT